MLAQVDPVILATGHTYDRSSIERWLEQGHKTCPVTGMRLRHLELTPNFALRSAIQVRPGFCGGHALLRPFDLQVCVQHR
jgi:hypothetical protein